jgi:hypothetical protein
MNVQPIKQRFGIIGSSPLLDRAIEIAAQVAPYGPERTDQAEKAEVARK